MASSVQLEIQTLDSVSDKEKLIFLTHPITFLQSTDGFIVFAWSAQMGGADADKKIIIASKNGKKLSATDWCRKSEALPSLFF